MTEVATRRCPACRESKPLSAFSPNPSRRGGGLAAHCKPCNAETMRIRRRNGKEAHLAERQRERRLLAKYGITQEDYDRLLAEQGGACAICTQPPRRRRLDVDHDHGSGVVRGLLCYPCNAAIGLLGDDPDRILAASMYLLRATARQGVIV